MLLLSVHTSRASVCSYLTLCCPSWMEVSLLGREGGNKRSCEVLLCLGSQPDVICPELLLALPFFLH